MTAAEPPIQYDAFISYARADGRDLAERLYHALKDRGLRPWRDVSDLNPHQDFSVMIEEAIPVAGQVVVLLTPDVVNRKDSFVRREILYAQAHHKPITPLICAGFDEKKVPILVNHLTWLPFTDFDRHLPALLERLNAPEVYSPPELPDDPFRDYVTGLRDFTVRALGESLLNIHNILSLTAKDTPEAVPPRVLPTAFRSRWLAVNNPPLPKDTHSRTLMTVLRRIRGGFSCWANRVRANQPPSWPLPARKPTSAWRM
jgi:hypothetical protein